jgi:Flp pilus assembly protein TadG
MAGFWRERSSADGHVDGERGAALVEFAIILPLIFALILGLTTGGLSLSRKNSMTNAVREGARMGATLPENAAWGTSVRDRVTSLSGNDLIASQVCVKLVRKATATTETVRSVVPASGCPFGGEPSSTGIPAGECVVKVWARRTSDLEVLLFSRPLTLQDSSVSRYERAGAPADCAL